jgi:hypothetical protein
MSAGLADLVHDAAVLHGFVDFLEEYCKEQERSQTYIDASGLFFRYVERLATGIKRELRNEVGRATRLPATRVPTRLPVLRRNLLTLKYYLRLLHALIKPAADAHTLTIPAPLIDLASQQLQGVEGMKNSKIVILLTPEFMYFQRPHTHIKEQARIVRTFIPKSTFPAKLGFIELPYSQGPSFFTNLALHHEIGHFVYEELSNQNPPHPDIKALQLVTHRSLRKVFKNPQVFALAVKIIESWTQEIFCDLFAIRLLGPAFSFALVEILGMLGFLSQKATEKFNPSHPASAFRFAEHVEMLRRDTWWDAIADINPEQKKLLQQLAQTPRSSYKFYVDDTILGPTSLVDAFLDSVVPVIRKLVHQVTNKSKPSVKRFKETRPEIEECLKVGVVPHTTNPRGLDPVSIINASFCFYLTSLPNVIKVFDGAKAQNSVEKNSQWMKRVENWTMKAIEDSQIQDRFRRNAKLWSFLENKY